MYESRFLSEDFLLPKADGSRVAVEATQIKSPDLHQFVNFLLINRYLSYSEECSKYL